MLKPKKTEHQKDFIERCNIKLIKEGNQPNIAINTCNDIWNTKMDEKQPKIKYNKKRYGFDFDGVLSKPVYQFLAEYLIGLNKQVFVITKRDSDNSTQLYQITDKLGIPRENIVFTANAHKSPFTAKFDLDYFLDDQQNNIDDINQHDPECIAILIK